MRKQELEETVRNIDRRLGKVEQILPTLATREELAAAVAPLATKEELAAAVAPLATKEELHSAIAAAIAPLATREELHSAIAAAVAPLATRTELQSEIAAVRAEIRAEGVETRRHFDVVAESLRDDIRLIAESHLALNRKVDTLDVERRKDIASLDARVTRLEAQS